MMLGDNAQIVTYTLAAIVAAIVVVSKLSASRKLDAFPTVGPTIWSGLWKKEKDTTQLIQEGYAKYKPAPFKITKGFDWVIVLGDRKHLEEVETAPGDVIGRGDLLTTDEVVGNKKELSEDAYVHSIMSRLNRNLTDMYDDVQDEIVASFDDVLDLRENEWKSVPAVATVEQIICRVTNRIFVGLPLCRNPDWIALNLRYSLDVGMWIMRLWGIPDFLAPFVVKYWTEVPRCLERGAKLLVPIIQERRRLMEEHGKDWTGKPNDFLSWILDAKPNDTARLTMHRLSAFNFASIHTSTMSFSHVLFYLVKYPEYIQPLRDEVESIVIKEGWSRASVGKMYKVDSFLKESMRLTGVSTATITRRAIKDFTLSDGMTIPKGVLVMGPSREFHRNSEVYPNADEFNPFRFSDMQDDKPAAKNESTWVNSVDYMPFGHGKHVCTGRFFVANELRSMLAHIVTSYDIKLEGSKDRPTELIYGSAIVPDQTVRLMFRKRVA